MRQIVELLSILNDYNWSASYFNSEKGRMVRVLIKDNSYIFTEKAFKKIEKLKNEIAKIEELNNI